MPSQDSGLRFDSIEDSLAAFKTGAFIIVVDSQSRENEGDLIASAAQMTAEKMAFMVRHTSGLICAPLSGALADRLELPPMVRDNQDPKGTAYTVSVDDASPQTTTGISAHDRALTCRVLADPAATALSLRRPGHVLPLRARPGGIRQRAGHTEAAVEFCRLAGQPPERCVGVIAELVDDGTVVPGVAELRGGDMLRRDGCLAFARAWGLRCCTTEDLVAYVEKHEGEMKSVNGG